MAKRPPYTVARYLVDRLRTLGVEHIFQVPGNYTAQFLLEAHGRGIQCVGTKTEQEAGYAADGYARLSGLGVICTTYGVGSLSAMNAIAGARVELCPVVLINGGPNQSKTAALEEYGQKFAHAIDTDVTDERLFRLLTPTAVITDPEDAPEQIDRLLRTCLTTGLPVYLESRDGVWDMECCAPMDPDAANALMPFEPSSERKELEELSVVAAVEAVITRLKEAKAPILWGGEELQRVRLEASFEDLIRSTKLKYTTTLMAKSLVPETSPGHPSKRRQEFIGVYDSLFAPADVAQVVENSDCVLALGTILSDFYGKIVEKTTATGALILAAAGAVRVGYPEVKDPATDELVVPMRQALYPNVPLRLFVPKLLEAIKKEGEASAAAPAGFEQLPPPAFWQPAKPPAEALGGRLAVGLQQPAKSGMDWLEAFTEIQKHVGPGTLVMADTSLALFPAAELLIPSQNHFIAQTCWLSIGYTVGAAVGACARMKAGDRALVLVGDGGFYMGPQALTTLATLRAPVTVVVFDNALYAVEQFLVVTQLAKDDPSQLDFYSAGSTQPGIFFNQLEIHQPESDAKPGVRWNYEALAAAFGCRWGGKPGDTIDTPGKLDTALADSRDVTGPTLIAARIDPRSLPPELEQAVARTPPTFGSPADAVTAAQPRPRVAWRAFN